MRTRDKNKAKEKIDSTTRTYKWGGVKLRKSRFFEVPYKVSFDDAVHRVIMLFMAPMEKHSHTFLSPDADWNSLEGETYGETICTYLPLRKAIRQFNAYDIVQAVFKKIEDTKNNDHQCYEDILQEQIITPLHYFIGTMDARVINFLLTKKNQCLDAGQYPFGTPLDVLANVLAYLEKGKFLPYVTDKSPAPKPNAEFIGIIINHIKISFLETHKKQEIKPALLRAIIPFLKHSPLKEERFKLCLTDKSIKLYEAQKQKLNEGDRSLTSQKIG